MAESAEPHADGGQEKLLTPEALRAFHRLLKEWLDAGDQQGDRTGGAIERGGSGNHTELAKAVIAWATEHAYLEKSVPNSRQAADVAARFNSRDQERALLSRPPKALAGEGEEGRDG